MGSSHLEAAVINPDMPSSSLISFREIKHMKLSIQRRIDERRLHHLQILRNQKVVFNRKNGKIAALAIDKEDNTFLLCCGSNGCVDIMNLYTLEKSATFKAYNDELPRPLPFDQRFMINDCQWCDTDNKYFITVCVNRNISVCDVCTLTKVHDKRFDGNPIQLHWNEISRSNPRIALADMTTNIKILDFKAGFDAPSQELRWKNGVVCSVRWFPTSQELLLIGDMNGTVAYFDARSGKQALHSFPAHSAPVTNIRLTSDGLRLITVDMGRTVKVWDAKTLAELTSYKVESKGNSDVSRSNPRLSIGMCDDGESIRVAVPSGELVSILKVDWTNLNCECTRLAGHYKNVLSCVFRNSHHQLFTGGADGNLLWWAPTSDRTRVQMGIEATNSQIKNIREDAWSDNED